MRPQESLSSKFNFYIVLYLWRCMCIFELAVSLQLAVVRLSSPVTSRPNCKVAIIIIIIIRSFQTERGSRSRACVTYSNSQRYRRPHGAADRGVCLVRRRAISVDCHQQATSNCRRRGYVQPAWPANRFNQ